MSTGQQPFIYVGHAAQEYSLGFETLVLHTRSFTHILIWDLTTESHGTSTAGLWEALLLCVLKEGQIWSDHFTFSHNLFVMHPMCNGLWWQIFSSKTSVDITTWCKWIKFSPGFSIHKKNQQQCVHNPEDVVRNIISRTASSEEYCPWLIEGQVWVRVSMCVCVCASLSSEWKDKVTSLTRSGEQSPPYINTRHTQTHTHTFMAATSKIEKLFRATSSKRVMLKLPVNYVKLCLVFFSLMNTSPFVINK